ncbi:MAG: dihydrofolate reductase [Bacteroidales bacterium]
MSFSIIVAVAENWVIGGNNQLLWHISEDLKRFKALTTCHSIIMGRKTFESIGRPLPNRRNIIISHNHDLKIEGCEVVSSIDEAFYVTMSEDEVFVVGGGELYRRTLPLAEKLYLTKVHKDFEGDTTFPVINFDEWELVYEQKGNPTADGLGYTFLDYVRK